MRQLIVKQLDYDLTPVSGLALVGHCLESFGKSRLFSQSPREYTKRGEISASSSCQSG